MGSFNDPHVVAELIGTTFGVGAIAYFVASKAFPDRRTAQVARLMRDAGVEEQAETKARGWQPPPALVGIVAAGLALVWSAGKLLVVSASFSPKDLPQLRAGLVNGCETSCTKGGGAATWCNQVCTCARVELESHHPGDEALVEWFSAAAKKDDLALGQWSGAQALCFERTPTP
jgi:hypothetical protein